MTVLLPTASVTPMALPEHLLTERFLAGSGPGGQNANKVATACQLHLNVWALGLPPAVYRRLKVLAGAKLTMGGELVVLARSHRTREANRADARERLEALLAEAHDLPARRRKTRPSSGAKARRTDSKTARGRVKAARGRVSHD